MQVSTMSLFEQEFTKQPNFLREVLGIYGDDSGSAHSGLMQIARDYLDRKMSSVLFVGMGSSLSVGQAASAYLLEKGTVASAVAASEVLHYGLARIRDDVLTVMVSQSGESGEIKALLDKIPDRGNVVAITNEPRSTLGRSAKHVLRTFSGREESSASVTYTTSLLAAMLMCYEVVRAQGREVSEDLQAIRGLVDDMDSCFETQNRLIGPVMSHLGADMTYVALLGRGPSFATAYLGSVLIKEIVNINAEPITQGEFRHGPIESVDHNYRALMFAPAGRTFEMDLTLAREMCEYGAKIALITDATDEQLGQTPAGLFRVPINPGSELLAPFQEIVFVDYFCCRLAESRNLPVGAFRQFHKVTDNENGLAANVLKKD